MYQIGVSIQLILGFSVGNFLLIVWGFIDFDGIFVLVGVVVKEIDLMVVYILGCFGLIVLVVDLWWVGQGVCKYFNFKSYEMVYYFEVGVVYIVQFEIFFLFVVWYIMFVG